MDAFDDENDVYKPEHAEEVVEPSSKLYSFQNNELPIDWSLKSSVSFQADFQLIWAKTISPQICFHNNKQQQQQTDFRQLFSNGLEQYCYGIASTSPSLRNWRNSFRSLYYSCRLGDCESFYLKGPEFTVLFRSPTQTVTDGKYVCVAYVSNATRSFKDKLQQGQVELSRLLEEDDEEEEDDRMFLEVRDNLNVNGLFEIIMEHFEAVERDLPILISSTPFVNAVVSKAKIEFPTVINQTNNSRIYRLKVRYETGSWILPQAAKQLCDALALCAGKDNGGRGAFKVNFEYTDADMFPNMFVCEDEVGADFVSPMQQAKYGTSNNLYTVYSNAQP